MISFSSSSTSLEDRRWNRMSDRMAGFHAYFRNIPIVNEVYELSDGSYSKKRMTLRQYLRLASDLIEHLTFHHNIEEAHIFPVLSKRMPEFANGARHKQAHKAIHDGLDQLGALVTKCQNNPTAYSPEDMKAVLDGFRGVLFEHLDQEVKDLKAENLKNYYTLAEVDRLPM